MPTEEEIEAQKTPNGGWTKKTLEGWGVPWPPPAGWKERLIQEKKMTNIKPYDHIDPSYSRTKERHFRKRAEKKKRMAEKIEKRKAAAKIRSDSFYKSEEWMAVRYQALKLWGAACQCCGANRTTGAVIHVDHIKPRSRFPQLALELSNLQILCARCNLAKRAADMTDWRTDQERQMLKTLDAVNWRQW